jgi:uncharacterized protein YjbI with pentapeptide repeats
MKARMTFANLNGCDLTRANLTSASLHGADLTKANLHLLQPAKPASKMKNSLATIGYKPS